MPTSNSKPADTGDQFTSSKRTPPTCICGQRHWWGLCQYLVPAVRTHGWVKDPKIRAIFEEKRKDPKLREQMDRSIARHARRAKKQSEAANLTVHELEDDELQVPAIAAASFATCGPNSKATLSLFGQHSTNSLIAMSAHADTEFKNSWVLDTATTCHVSNNKSRFTEFTMITGSMKVGDTQSTYEGIGTTYVLAHHPVTNQIT